MKTLCSVLLLAIVGCTSSSDQVELVKGFDPPPVPDGYTRYVLPAIHGLQPGENKLFCQWIALANTEDVDIVDIQGYQSATGHHVVLYSTSETEAIGTSRECTTADMVSVEFLGGAGGEGSPNSAKLPDGYVFRQGKERMLLGNAHYLNATDTIQDVQSVIDVKTAPPSPDRKPVGMAGINYADFQIPPNTPSYTTDAYCKWPRDTSIVMWSNHMHSAGTSVMSEVKRADGTIEQLAADPHWSPEQAFNPTWAKFPASAPMVIKTGDTVHVQCTWQNNTNAMMAFPDEMCDAVGMYTDAPDQAICDGTTTP